MVEQIALHNTVKSYYRHFFACTGHSDWPSHIDTQQDLLGKMVAEVANVTGKQLPPKFTACDAVSKKQGIDLLVFPDNICYLDVTEEKWQTILQQHVIAGQIANDVPHSDITGTYIFVCIHQSRDERCGRCGPPIIEALRRESQRCNMSDVHVHGVSHVGGHKYAGNVLIYPDGVWYGYVQPQHAAKILEQHVNSGNIIEQLYRGRMSVGSDIS